ncbi:MAG: glutathione S-transferase family protein [gamma proteobacterium symbiont of Phacoides pectinatus]
MPHPTLIIGNKNYSSWSLRPWILLKHFQVPFEEKRVALFTETTDAELKPYNSDLKVPVLQDGNLLIWDSLAILEYISEQYLDNRGWPDDPAARATARSVSAEMHSSFPNVRGEFPMNCRKHFDNIQPSREAEREIRRIKALWRECRERFGSGGEWLFGDYTIADAMYAPIALRLAGYSLPLEGIERDYVESVLKQPAIIEWIATGKAETEIIEEDQI